MSKYTIELRFLIENKFPITLDQYPIFEESYRELLNKKIIEHYYFREIGLETPAKFNYFLKRKMNEIMPYYNQLYLSEKIKIEPLLRVKMEITNKTNNNSINNIDNTTIGTIVNNNEMSNTETTIGNNENTSTDKNFSNSINNSDNKNLFSDTPSGKLESLENGNYLTNATFNKDLSNSETNSENESDNISKSKSSSDSNGTSNSTTSQNNSSKFVNNNEATSENIMTQLGNVGITDSAMLMEYRKTFQNIDLMIIDELNELFINIW